jgi:hypothetical protein
MASPLSLAESASAEVSRHFFCFTEAETLLRATLPSTLTELVLEKLHIEDNFTRVLKGIMRARSKEIARMPPMLNEHNFEVVKIRNRCYTVRYCRNMREFLQPWFPKQCCFDRNVVLLHFTKFCVSVPKESVLVFVAPYNQDPSRWSFEFCCIFCDGE